MRQLEVAHGGRVEAREHVQAAIGPVGRGGRQLDERLERPARQRFTNVAVYVLARPTAVRVGCETSVRMQKQA